MEKTPSEIEGYVSRDYYNRQLQSLRDQYKPEYLIGYRNPYTGKVIRTEVEADSYLQQQAISSAYRQAADIALFNIRSAAETKISVLESRVTELERKRGRSKAISIFLSLAILIGVFTVPDMFKNEYDSGYEKGYAAGKVYSSSRASSYGSSSSGRASSGSSYSGGTSYGSSSSSSGETLMDVYLRRQAESQSSIYKTTPIAGYSLDMTVYVSISGGKIHRRSNCSGMKNYNTMTYGEACEKGYVHCKKCF